MDRVDRWLNAQRGWRQLLICWLVVVPALVNGGLLWSARGNVDGQATVPTGSVLVHVVIAALAGIPLAVLSAGLLRRHRKSRPRTAGLSWRMITALSVIIIPQCVTSYGQTRTWAWQHQHVPYGVLMLAGALGLVMLFWNALYWRKLRRQAEASAQDSGN